MQSIVEEEWKEYDDHLVISDDDDSESEQTQNTHSLFVPQFVLKTKGSVVDMLMDGPFTKQKQPTFSKSISIDSAAVEVHDADDDSKC